MRQLEQLILMVNQIVENNSYNISDAQTIEITKNHLKTFWARSMKKSIIDHVNSGGKELNELARKSVELLSEYYSDKKSNNE